MKKRAVLSVILLSIILSTFLVSAQYSFSSNDIGGSAQNFVNVVGDALGPVFQGLLGTDSYDEYLFARVLFLLLVYFIVFIVLQNVPIFKGYNFIIILVSGIIAILGARYVTEVQFIEGMLLPQGVLMIALATFIPFLIYGYLVHKTLTGGFARRFAWILFASVFIGLWISRSDSIQGFGWIYGILLVGVAITVIFDEKVHEYFGISEARAARKARISAEIAGLEADLGRLRATPLPHSVHLTNSIDILEKKIENLYKKL